MRNAILFLFLFTLTTINSSSQVEVGGWRYHLPYSNIYEFVDAGDRIYCSSKGGLLFYDKTDNSFSTLTKLDGLNGIEISALEYHPELDLLFISYANSDIDIIKDNQIHNFPEIRQKPVNGSKAINDILIYEDFAFLACDFGIVKFNLRDFEFTDTYFLGSAGDNLIVNGLSMQNDSIYASTEQGVYKADINDPFLVNFDNWENLSGIPGPSENIYFYDFVKNHPVCVVYNPENRLEYVYFFNNGIWTLLRANVDFNGLNDLGDSFVFSMKHFIMFFDYNPVLLDEIRTIQTEEVFLEKTSITDLNIIDNQIWISNEQLGLLIRQNDNNFNLIQGINGPGSEFTFDINIKDNRIIATKGGTTSGWNNLINPAEFYIYENGDWNTFNTSNVPEFGNAIDLLAVEVHPENNDIFYISSWNYGLFEWNNGTITHYHEENSSLQTIFDNDSWFVRVRGLEFDRNNNLWITNTEVEEPLVIKKADGEWLSLSYPAISGRGIFLGDLIFTQNTSTEYLWMFLPRGKSWSGIFVLDNNQTLESKEDDRYKVIVPTDENNNVITNWINCLAEDHDGEIWVGTDKGIVVYYEPEAIFDNPERFYASQIKVPRNDGTNLADYLLETENITAIAVDGANRKWIGTSNSGLYLVSESGTEIIKSFKEENSPLLSNSISSISIDNNSGEVYVGTAKGLVSYRGEAIEAKRSFENVYAFPNPVRENYEGVITITGLVENTIVKITDINGNLVYETNSLGGQAIWDGRNFSGKRVATGVYLILCSDEGGNDSVASKILFIN